MKKTRTFRFNLPKAKPGDGYAYRVNAVYGPGRNPRPVCGVCWSQLDMEWGKDLTSRDEYKYLKGSTDGDYIDAPGS